MPIKGASAFEFDGFRLDLRSRSLKNSGRHVSVRPKCFDVLAFMVENAGELVTKEMIFDAVWPGVTVSDESLTRCISDIRKALGDRQRRIIRTVPGRGYLLAASVRPCPAMQAERHAKGLGNRWIAALGVLAIIVVSAYLLAPVVVERINGPWQADKQASIVILPLDNLDPGSRQDYFTDGLTDDITTDLSRVPDLFVIARNSAHAYADRTVDARRIAGELGVRYVLEGSVRRMGDILRINVQLVDGHSGGQVWAERYDGSMDDVFAFQENVVANVVSALQLRLDTDVAARRRLAETENPKAYDAFLEGWAHYLERTPTDYATAARHFKRALDIDPDYGRAYAALASTYWEGWERWWFQALGFDAWIEPRQEAERYLELALQRPSALAHAVASEVRRQQGRYDDMLREARTAVRLEPGDPNNYVSLIFALSLYGKHAEALAAVDHAMALDPHYPAFFLYQKGFVLFSMRRYEEAAQFLERALERNPYNHSPNAFLVAAYAKLDDLKMARRQLAKHPHPLSLEWIRYYYRYREAGDLAHLLDSLKLAGVPEIATEVPRPPAS